MSSYELSVYITDELYEWTDSNSDYSDPYRAQSRAETYIKDAFQDAGHTVSVITPDQTITAPKQNTNEGTFTAPCPCNPLKSCSFAHLLDWWERKLECEGYTIAEDSNVLLTNTNNADGGRGNKCGPYCVVQSGQKVCEINSSPITYGYDQAANAMHTVLHEIGHNMMCSVTDGDNDGIGHHDQGAVKAGYDGDTMTPMKVDNDEEDFSSGVNNCNVTWTDPNVQGHYLHYSECALGDFK